MRVLIIEGIATSGKSTLIQRLREKSPEGTVRVYGEAETHLPIMDKRGGLHLEFFNQLLDRALGQDSLVVFDRLYMTQAYRAGATMSDYVSIERRLQQANATTVLLVVDEAAILPRLEAAMKHRDPAWAEYVRGKAESVAAAAGQYIEQQRAMLQFAEDSLLPSRTFNTSGHLYGPILDELLAS